MRRGGSDPSAMTGLLCLSAVLLLCLLSLCGAQPSSDLIPATSLPSSIAALLGLNGSASGALWTPVSPSAVPTSVEDSLTAALQWSTTSSPSPYPVTFAPLLSQSNLSTAEYFASLLSAQATRVSQQCDFDPTAVLAPSIPLPSLLSLYPAANDSSPGSAWLAQWPPLGYPVFAARLQSLASDPHCALAYTKYAATRLRARSDAQWYSDSPRPGPPAAYGLNPSLHLQPASPTTYVCTGAQAVQTQCNASAIVAAAYPPRALDPGQALSLSGLPQRPPAAQCPATVGSALAQTWQSERLLATLAAFALPAATKAVQCGARGWWSARDGGCRCYAGWAGPSCQQQLPCLTDASRGSVCSGAGRCNAAGAATPCTCAPGYAGPVCAQAAALPALLVGEQSASTTAVAGVCTPAAYGRLAAAVTAACPAAVWPMSAAVVAAVNASMWAVLVPANDTGPAVGCALRDCVSRLAAYTACVDARWHAEGAQWAVVSAPLYALQQLLPPVIAAVKGLQCNASQAVSKAGQLPPQGLSANCSGVGRWTGAQCICPYPATGPTCASTDAALCPLQCSGHGQCVAAVNSAPVCACNAGWTGSGCSVSSAAPVSIRAVLFYALTAYSAVIPGAHFNLSTLACTSLPSSSPTYAALLQAECNVAPAAVLAGGGQAAMTRACALATVAYITCDLAQQPYLPQTYAFIPGTCPAPTATRFNTTAGVVLQPYLTPAVLSTLQTAYRTLAAFANATGSAAVGGAATVLRAGATLAATPPPCEKLAREVQGWCGVDVSSRLLPATSVACNGTQCAASLLAYARCYVNRTHAAANATAVPINAGLYTWLTSPVCAWNNATAKRLATVPTPSTYVWPTPPLTLYPSCAGHAINSSATLARLSISRLQLQSTLMASSSATNLAAAGAAMASTCGFDFLAPPVPAALVPLTTASCLQLSPACAVNAVGYYLQLTSSYGVRSTNSCQPTSAFPLIAAPQLGFLQCAATLLQSLVCPVPFLLVAPVGASLTPTNCSNCSVTAAVVFSACNITVGTPLNANVLTGVSFTFPGVACAKAVAAYANCTRTAISCSTVPAGQCPANLGPLLSVTYGWLYARTHPSSTAPAVSSSTVASSSAASSSAHVSSSAVSSSAAVTSSMTSPAVSSSVTSAPLVVVSSSAAPTSAPVLPTFPASTSAPSPTSAPTSAPLATSTPVPATSPLVPSSTAPATSAPVLVTSPPFVFVTSSTAPATVPTPPGSTSSTPVGAIVGGVVGGLLGCLLLLCFLFFLVAAARRREKDKSAASSFDASQMSERPPVVTVTTAVELQQRTIMPDAPPPGLAPPPLPPRPPSASSTVWHNGEPV